MIFPYYYIDSLVQDCGDSSALAMVNTMYADALAPCATMPFSDILRHG